MNIDNSTCLPKFRCYYCTSTFISLPEIVSHTSKSHEKEYLKIKVLELNALSGKLGYRTHSFNIIPKDVETNGKRIKVQETSKALEIHVISEEGEKELSIASPIPKKSKRDQYENCPSDAPPLENDHSSEEKILCALVPKVVEKLKEAGKIDIWIKFNELLSTGNFPLSNIAFLLFLDVVRFYDCENTTSMRYDDPSVNMFWRIGFKMFHAKWLRFMSGPKNKGDLINEWTSRGNFHPSSAKINFCVPFSKVKNISDSPVPPNQVRPGIINHLLQKFSEQATPQQTFKLCFDGKKINSSLTEKNGDIDLFGFEGPPTLGERQQRLQQEQSLITELQSKLQEEMIKSRTSIENISEESKSKTIDSFRELIFIISKRINELREAYVSKDMALSKFKKMAGHDWRKRKLLYVISAIETHKYDIYSNISCLIDLVGKIGIVLSELCKTSHLYSTSKTVSLSEQSNYVHLKDTLRTVEMEDIDYRFVKQRSEMWHSIRKTAVVTGSTLYAAIGLDAMKKQLEHFDYVFFQKEKPEFSSAVKEKMEHGVLNEINAVSTLVSKILPVFFPGLTFYEEGCYRIKAHVDMIVSPDGSCRDEQDKPILAVEIKCPAPKEGMLMKPAQHYSIPKYYVTQILAEMAALNVDKLLYVCYTAESTTVHVVTFSPDLWADICSELQIYGQPKPKRPTVKSSNIALLQSKIAKFLNTNVVFLCEIASCIAVDCQIPSSESELFCRHNSRIMTETVELSVIQSWLRESELKIDNAFNLTRSRASEFLGFMISDVDRLYRQDEIQSVPIAYAMKGYSLTNETMRKMMEYVLYECANKGLYVPVCCFDGQWYRMTVRDRNDAPLTMLQLQKELWNRVKKIDKGTLFKIIANKGLLTDMSKANIEDVTEKIELQHVITEKSSNHFYQRETTTEDYNLIIHTFTVGTLKGERTLTLSSTLRKMIIEDLTSVPKRKRALPNENDQNLNEEENICRRTNDIMSSIPEDIEVNANEAISDQVEKVAISMSSDPEREVHHFDFQDSMNISTLFQDSSLKETAVDMHGVSIDNTNTDNDQEIQDAVIVENQDDTAHTHQEPLLKNEDLKNMLKAIKDYKASKKSWDIPFSEFSEKFKNASTIDKHFTKAELTICLEPVMDKLKSKGIKINKSSQKHQLVTILSKLLGDGSMPSKKKIARKNAESLRNLAKRVVSKYSKETLNCIYAEYLYPEELDRWYHDCPFGSDINIEGIEVPKYINWYSRPEYNIVLNNYLFLILDSYHQICGARRLLCQSGIPSCGIKKDAVYRVARESNLNNCGLSVAMAVDMIDKQNVEFAKTTFNPKVSDALEKNGDVNEASFCRLVYQWYLAEDEPGMSVLERISNRLALREWLLDGVDFSKFPPYGSHVKDIPIVLFEGLLTNIERKIQLFPFTKRGCYNVRAIGSLDIENFFGSFQDLDPRGTGVLAPADIPMALSVAIELLDAKLNPERGFFMNTSKAKVYPCNEFEHTDTETEMEVSDCSTVKDLSMISPLNHQFDMEFRNRGKQKRKRGDVSQLNLPARGIQPVRQFHKRDESKILPHIRRGLDFKDF